MNERVIDRQVSWSARGRIGVLAALLLLPACAGAAKETGAAATAAPAPAAKARTTRKAGLLPSIDARALASITEEDRKTLDDTESQLAEALSPAEEAKRQGALLLKQAESARVQQRALEVELRLLGDMLDDPAALRGKADEVLGRRARIEAEVEKRRGEAIRAYAAFVDDPANRGVPERGKALLALARTLKEAGQGEAAIARWEAFLAEGSPKPAEAAEAHLALVDLLFEAEKLDAVLAHCDAVVKGGTESQRAKALYVKSWALRGLNERLRPDAMREAMEALREVVRLGGTGEARVVIASAAESELIELYARHGDESEADAFFSGAGGAAARLGAAYKERKQRTTDAPRRGRGPFID